MKYNIKNLSIILAVILAANIILRKICTFLFDENLTYITSVKLIMVIISLVIIFKSDIAKKITFTPKHIFYFLISAILILLSYFKLDDIIQSSSLERNNVHNAAFLTHCLSTSMFEELTFRVFVFYFLLESLNNNKNQLLLAFLITSFVFGFAHFGNMLRPGFHIFSAIVQVVFAIAVGFILQSIYIRTKSLVLIISIHAIVNYFGSYKGYLFNQTGGFEYSVNMFIQSVIIALLFTMLIALPISHWLINKQIKNNSF